MKSVLRRVNWRRSLAVSSVSAAALGLTVGGASALAMSAPIHITSTVNIRPGPSTTSGGPIGAIPTGASPDFQCWTQGQNISGVDVWFRIDYNGVNGYYASYWDDSSYKTDWEIVPKYGIPNCGSAPSPPAVETPAPAPGPPATPPAAPGPTPAPPSPSSGPVGPSPSGPTAAENGAINWANVFAARRSGSYHNLCLTFVFRAYEAAGINLRHWVTVPIGWNTYPQDIWGHFSHGHTGGGVPPAGALVFFRGWGGNRTLSHVVLSTGGGNLISTSDRVAGYIHYESMAEHRYAVYLGWWLPDR